MIRIFSDSTCDLSKDLLKKYNIGILPLHVLLGDNEYIDGVNITPDEIYAWADENKTTPKTSAPAVNDIVDVFKPVIDAGDEIICFSVSQSMSSSYSVMNLAASELEAEDRIYVIDSANLSTGVGLLVIEAAEKAAKGLSATEIVSYIEELKPNVRASFVVDTLTYLHRGGRCSAVAALAGSVLKLHPKIVVENGKMDATKKYRGKIGFSIFSYVKDMNDELLKAKRNRVFITHSGCDESIITEVKTYLKELGHFDEILVTRAGAVISSHCGYGTLGVLFIAE
ncbi:MAG: DegV family protein [Lachnospiraceae bacterium]|nr:DegV family protein [Lachnospiraceae bacterium]